MEFPVDLLADCSQGEQERLSEEYMKSILCTNPDALQKVTLANRTQVSIGLTNVGFVPLYGTNDRQKVLALFCPSDQLTAVALYLRNRWWTVDQILRTGNTARDGILQVQSMGERMVLYTLNRVVYRAHEMSSSELPFLCHGEKDYAKVLWKNGEAVGFYSVKPAGSLCSALSTQRYQLPVMDSMFVRKCHRGNGFGVQMLEDFVSSFKDDCLGVRYPVSKAMFKVCEMYLSQYPGDRDVLWEVEGVGGPTQRTNIANKIHTMNMSAVSRNLTFTEKSIVSSEVTETDVVMEEIASHNKNSESVEYTVQISEEVTVVRASKEIDEIPVTTRVRSTGLKQRKMREETEEVSSMPTPDTAVLTLSEVPEKIEANMEQTLVDEEPQTPEVTPEIPKLQRAMVVIVDLKASCHEPQVEEMEELTHIKQNIPAEKTYEEVTPSIVETRALRSKTKTVAEIPQKRRPLRERPEVDYKEACNDDIETAAVIDSNNDSVSVGDEEDNMKTVAAPSTIEAQVDVDAALAETDKELNKMTAVVETHEKEEMQCEETDEISINLTSETAVTTINLTSETAVTTLNEVPEQAEVGVSSSEEAEAPVAATRTLRDRKKTVEATPTRKSTRHKQVQEKKEKEVAAMESSNGKEEPVVGTRVLGRGRKSAPVAPKHKSKRLSIQQKEAEVEEKEQSTSAEDIKVQEEDATVETIAEMEPNTDKEIEAENTEQESGTPEDESEELELEAEKEHTKENEVEEEKGEGVEAETPEGEPVPLSVEGEEELEGVTQEPPKESATEASQEVAAVEMVEGEIVHSEEAEEVSPTPSPDSAMVTPSEPAPVSVEEKELVEGITQETPLAQPETEERQKDVGVESVGDEIVQNEEAGEVSHEPTPDTAVVTASELAPASVEEEEPAGVKQDIPLAEPTTEESQEVSAVERVEDEIANKDETDKVSSDTDVVTPIEVSGNIDDNMTQIPAESADVTSLCEVPELAEVGVSSSKEAEAPVATTRTLRDRKKTVEATPRRKSSRHKQVEEKEVAAMESSNDKEEPVVETRILRRGRKSAPAEATPSSKSTRNKQQEEKKGKEETAVETNNDKEEPVSETRVLRRGRKSAPVAPRRESKIVRKQQMESEVEEKEGSTTAEDIKVQEEDATVETPDGTKEPMLDKETEGENTEQESGTPEDETEKTETVAEKEHTKETDEEKEKGEVVEAEIPEVEPAPVSVEEEEQVAGVTQEPPLAEPATEESQVVAAVEAVEDEIVPSEEAEELSPTLSPDSAIVTPSEPAPVSVEEEEKVGVTQDTPLAEPAMEESQEVSAVQRVEDEVQNNDKTEVSSTPTPDTDVVTPNEVPEKIEDSMTQTPAGEEPQKEVTSQIPKLQRAAVVLVDLKATRHDPQIEDIEETTSIQQNISAEETDEKAPPSTIEGGVEMQAADEHMAETDRDKKQMTAVVETSENEIVQNEGTDEMSTNLTTDSAVTTPTEVPEQAKVGVSSSEEVETPVAATRTLRDRKKTVEATPRRKSSRHKQVEEKEVAAMESSNDKEEPVVETRILRRGRKSAPAEATPSSKSTRNKQQEEKKGKEETAVETNNDKEEPVSETRVLRRGRKSAPVAPRRESKRVCKQQMESEVEEKEGSTTVEDIKVQEEDATVETPDGTKEPMLDKETEGENTEQESGTPEDETEKTETVAEKEHTKETDEEKEKGEVVEAEIPEVEPAPVSVEEEEQVAGVTQEPPLAEPATEESQVVAAVEAVEDEIVPSEEAEELSPTLSPDSAIVTPSEPALVSVEQEEKVGVTQDTPLAEPAMEESQEVSAVQRVEDEVQNYDKTEVSSTPTPDTDVVTPNEVPEKIEDSMTQTPAGEEPQKEVTSQIPKLQRAAVVLVDLKATRHDPQIEDIEETTSIQQNVSAEETDEKAPPSTIEEEVEMQAAEEHMAETDRDKKQMTAVVETSENEIVQNEETDEMSTNLTTDSAVTTPTEVPEKAKVGVSSSEEVETPVAATKTLRDRKKSVEATPTRKSTRHIQQEDDKEEPVVETRVLRRGKKSTPAEATPSPKSTRSKRQEEKKDKKATEVETNNDKEEPVVETRVLRRGRKSAPVAPRRESKRVRKQQKEAEDDEQEDSTTAEEIKLQEEVATVETKEPTTDKETEAENTEQESRTPEDESEEPEIEAEKEHTEENEVEKEKGEGVEVETPEVKPTPVSVEEEEQVGVTQDTLIEEPAIEESQEVAGVESVGDESVHNEEAEEVSSTPTADSAMVTPSEPLPVSVEEKEQVVVTQETSLAELVTEESQEVAAADKVGDEIANNEETVEESSALIPDTAVVKPSEVPETIEESTTQTPADEEPQRQIPSQMPKLQRAPVVLVDLKATCHDHQVEEVEETTPIQQNVSAEKTDEEAPASAIEEEVEMQAAVAGETMAETDKGKKQITAVVETSEMEIVQNEETDVMSTNLTTDSAVTTPPEVPDQAKVGVSSSEEVETPVAATRTLRDRKKSVEATPKRKSTRHKQQEEDKEEPVVETRVIRRGKRSAPAEATPSPKSTRSKHQEENKDKEATVVETENDKEEPVVETRVLRRGRKSAPVAPRRESKRVRKQQREAEDEEQEDSTTAEEIKLQEEVATVETKEPTTDKETEAENTEQKSRTPEDESEEPEIEAEKAHTEENEVEKEKGEGVEAETPEVEPVSVEEEEQVEGVIQEPPLAERATEESQEVAGVESIGDESVHNEEAEEVSPTPDSAMVTPSEPLPVSVEEKEEVGVTQETPLAEPVTVDSQEVTAADKVGDEIANNEETAEESSTLISDTAVGKQSEVPETIEESTTHTPADEEPQRQIPSQIPKLQRASVVLVDLKATCHDRQVEIEETTSIQQNVSAEKTDEEAPSSAIEEEVEMQATVAEEHMAETDKDKNQMTAVVETSEMEIVQNEETDEMSTNLTTDSAVTTPPEVPEQAKVGVSSSEEVETPVAATRTLRDRKKSVEATPKRKSTRHKQQEEDKEEPVVETRVLRRGRKSAPVAPRRDSKRVRKQQKEAEDEEQEESITKVQKENVSVETTEETDEPKTVKQAEGENIEEESGTPESKEPELEEQKENIGNDVETEKGEGVEAETQTTEVEPTPASVKDEEQVEGVTQETPLAEPATEESQEVSLVERVEDESVHIVEAEEVGVTQETLLAEPATKESQEVAAVESVEDEIANNEETEEVGSTPAPDTAVVTPSEVPEKIEDSMTQTPADEDDEMKQQQGKEKEEKEPVEAESQEAESPVVETRALRSRTKAVADSPQIRSKRRRLEVEEVEEVEPTKRRSFREKPEVDYNENNEDEEHAPVSVEDEEQIEGVTQVAPLAEPATEESQEVAAVERVDDEIVQNEEDMDMSPTPNLQRSTVVLVDLKSTGHEPHMEYMDEITPERKRRSMRERPEVDYDENSDDGIATAEAVIDSNDEEDNVTELTATEETEKPVEEDTTQKRRSMRQRPKVDYDENRNDNIETVLQEEANDSNDEEDKVTELTANEETEKPEEEEEANGIDVTNSISGESEEDNIIKLALEEDEEEEKAETAEEEGGDELAISKESLIGKRILRGNRTSPLATHSPSPKTQKVETRARRSRTKADVETPKIKSKRRHLDEEEIEEVEPPKRRSTRQRPEVDYSEDTDITCPPVILSSSAKPRQSTKGKKAARERNKSSSDEEQEKISLSDKKRNVRKRTGTEPTPVRRSKRATNISE